MSINQIIFIIFTAFAVLGGLDRIFGNRLGLGAAFEKGFLTMGPLMLTMTGMIVLAPVLADLLEPVVVPLYRLLGADPAMFAGSFLACDMGGAPLASELTEDTQAATLGGILTASMLGSTVTFTIPVALGVMSREDRPYAAKGILCGIVTIPLGVFLAGLTTGFPIVMILKNLLPIVIVSALIALGLWKLERYLIRGFTLFGRLMTALSTFGLIAALVEHLTGWAPIGGMAPIDEAFLIVGEIALMLSGAFPLMLLLTKLLRKPLQKLGGKLHVNDQSVSGLMTTAVNSIAMFDTVGEMDPRGKVVNMAFSVSAAFVFGDHLAYTAGVEPTMIPALIVGKLSAGIAAILVALLMTRKSTTSDCAKQRKEAKNV